ncbi:MAG TPA: P-loop guanosine triphosphatase YjiA [Hyphomicrobiaceae bacterium MAG_BT-2024]
MLAPIPVIILTGFLGSGKTTLINSLLRLPEFTGTAVLINELGDVSLDHDLILDIDDELITTTTGCMCCTAAGDVQNALFGLWHRRTKRKISKFSRVIIEATGLVDPAPAIANLLTSPGGNLIQNTVITQFVLSSVVTLFDIVHGYSTLEQHPEAAKQVALADIIVLTKSDLVDNFKVKANVDRDRKALVKLNPGANILDKKHDWRLLNNALLTPKTYDLRSKEENASAWLDTDYYMEEGQNFHTHNHKHQSHDTSLITSHCILLEEAITPLMFSLFLNSLKVISGSDLLRMKGLFKLTDDPERPFVAHGVQQTIHPIHRLERWPSKDRRTRIILIGKGLKIKSIRAVLNLS